MMQRTGRTFLILALACMVLACSSDKKPPLKGERIPVLQVQETLSADNDASDATITLPEPYTNTAWPQAGGNATHMPQHLALGATLKKAWSTGIGDGSKKRRKLITVPVAAFDHIFTGDTEGNVSAFDIRNGKRLWETKILQDDDKLATI